MTRTVLGVAVLTGLLAAGCGGSSEDTAPEQQAKKERTLDRPVHTRPYRRPVPILMYHEVGSPPSGQASELYVSARAFEEEVRMLADQGYRGITLAQLEEAWRGRRKLPPHPVVLTFDDGYRGVYRNALPVLRRVGWPAVLNLSLGSTHSPDGLTREQVTSLVRDAHWQLASHTISHADLTRVAPAQLREEVAGSRRLAERWFRVPVRDFCYPAGRYDQRVIEAVRKAGYRTATTVKPGLATPDRPFELRRVRVEGSDGPATLRDKMRALGAS